MIYNLPLTGNISGGPNIEVDTATATSFPLYDEIKVSGSATLIGAYAIAHTGTPVLHKEIKTFWTASITPGVFGVTIFGQLIPAYLLTKQFVAVSRWDGASWDTYFMVDRSALIALSEIEDLTSAEILIGNASNRPTSIAVSGDITISNTGVTTIGAGKVLNSMINGVDATKLTGTIAAARIADKSLGNEVLSEVTLLTSSVATSVTAADLVEKTFFTGTIPAAMLINGDAVQLKAYIGIGGTANAKTIRCYLDGVQITANTVTTAPNGTDLIIDITVQRVTNNSAHAYGTYSFNGIVPEVTVIKSSAVTDFDVNGAVLTITGQNGVAAANEITFNGATFSVVR